MMRNDPHAWSDAELLTAAAARDAAAFSAFYRRHLSAVVAFLMRETQDPETAADLSAEVFAAVLLSASRYQPQGPSALPWVIGIARHKLLMSLRRGRVEVKARKRLGLDAVEFDDADVQRIERLAGAGAGRLEQLVERLPEQERHAVTSRVIDERSYREIAAELRCSELVVRKRVSRGLSRVREQLGDGESAINSKARRR
jgi:RNA polymerase sigma factor (sigma-70 family)